VVERRQLDDSIWCVVGDGGWCPGGGHDAHQSGRVRDIEAQRTQGRDPVTVDGVSGELLDISVGGAGVRLPAGLVPTTGLVELALPGAAPIKLEIARISTGQRAEADGSYEFASLRVGDRDWAAYAALSQWMFHTPDGAVPGLPHGVPLVGCKRSAGRG
jgi:cellulose synthase (UDP-forming)